MAAFPTITPSSFNLVSVNPTRITSATLNGIEQRSSGTGQYYRITATYTALSQAQIRQIMAHVAQHSGPLDSFTFELPSYYGTITGNGTSMGSNQTRAVGATSSTITIGAGSQPVMKAGDLFKFASHDKIYQIITDTSTTSISFRPALRTAHTSSSALTTTGLSMTVRYATDNTEFAINTDLFSNLTLEFIEVLS